MSKKKHQKKFKIPQKNTKHFQPDKSITDPDLLKPTFSFHHMKYGSPNCASICNHTVKASITDRLVRLSQLPWNKIKNEPKERLGFEIIPRKQVKFALPTIVTPEVPLLVFRLSQSDRIAGFRERDIYHLIAVGPDHTLY